ncbi:hypothetical protein Kpol_1070p34 [Vanderwaltozyma polyspora DSM 70294]|uniref:Zinc transporter YKE4 n=1 Tax=Vanderwaltozyma polyspora (strain ATCC 22028 / DSM 70294 / BCRC 21397 / CBS 2163 / NBRC 10782 / NRRL Y-8283 / UCD 57-17) TaxID=436907 RepID=A7TNN4_VANPO|nr:uncharacterized protein Kpol_1070p34 [Vanderwaltozyma polyspora DSM 70294]EDO16151.1 hypothetical protein Kpol_1070p34 [Vanderwaltozyma polyspora DSM 70294]
MISTFLSLVLCFGLTKGHGVGKHHHQHDNNERGELSAVITLLEKNLFAYGPRYNALIATTIIQIMPCVIVYLIPSLQKGVGESSFLTALVAFALGTLLGDIFLHLLPETLSVSDGDSEMKVPIMASGLFVGFMMFLIIEKLLRIISEPDGAPGEHIHSHGHSHSHGGTPEPILISASGYMQEKDDSNMKKRSKKDKKSKNKDKNLLTEEASNDEKKVNGSSENKITAYLNVLSGFAHNVTDGMALASSFYSSGQIGVITTVAVMFHEVPHELGDFALLLSSGFSFSQAVKSQLITSIGAILGTAIGCAINELPSSVNLDNNNGIQIQGIQLTDLMLPISTGGFIYIAAVGAVPGILQNVGTTKCAKLKTMALQLISICIGFVMMAVIAD